LLNEFSICTMNRGKLGLLSRFEARSVGKSAAPSLLLTGVSIMKSFADLSFFRAFDLLLDRANPGLKRSRWTYDGVEFERERISASGPKYGLAVEIYTLNRVPRPSWSLLVAKEYWWAGEDAKAMRSFRWARPTGGKRIEILKWLRAQEEKIRRL